MGLDFMIHFLWIDFITIHFISPEFLFMSIRVGMPFHPGIADPGASIAVVLAGVPDGEVLGAQHLKWVLEIHLLLTEWVWDSSDLWDLV